MEDRMESNCFFEDQLIIKMHTNFVHKFDLDGVSAAQLALEIMEILKISNSSLSDFESLYFQ